MNYQGLPYRIFPLGDSAITLDFGNKISETLNKEVIARFGELQKHPLPGMIEAVPAYSSLTVYYDLVALKKSVHGSHTVFEWMKEQLEERLKKPVEENILPERLVKIPVCYEDEFSPDIHQLALAKKITVDEVINIHTSRNYKVYMLGFLPGFTYMGEVDEKIAIPRKPQPQNVEAGSVGIAGKQTGIYPLASPGGWQIIGRTPQKLFEISPTSSAPNLRSAWLPSKEKAFEESFCLLHPGDTVQFYSISKNEFYEIQNKVFSK